MSRKFHLGDILSITTGFLVSPRMMDGIYDILDYMTGDDLFTHQLGRAAEECKPWLFRQHPQLKSIEYPTEPKPEDAYEWLKDQCKIYGDMLPVDPIPASNHVRKNPLNELYEMVDPKNVIVVDTGESAD